jgi:hypothetical protein
MSVVYLPFLEALADKLIDLDTDDVRYLLIDTGVYTPVQTHEFLSEVAAGARIGTAASVAGRTVTDGIWSCTSPISLTGVPDARTAHGGLYYVHTGTDATSRLIVFKNNGYGWPITTNANDVNIVIPSYILKLKPRAPNTA